MRIVAALAIVVVSALTARAQPALTPAQTLANVFDAKAYPTYKIVTVP